jgi:aminoglycoside N3'-acetyltransferase
MFNFSEWPKASFSLIPSENPFEESSLWGELCQRNGRICFLGADFSANTFIHYIEEKKGIGYRYLKPMPGVVVVGTEEDRVNFFFRARPRVDRAVEYDWDRLEADLVREHLLDCQPLGIGKILTYNAKDLLEYWLGRLEDDEFFFLTDASKAKIAELRRSKPYPFHFEDFEQEVEK